MAAALAVCETAEHRVHTFPSHVSPCLLSSQVAVSFVRLTFYGVMPPSLLALLSPVDVLSVAPRALAASALSVMWPSPTLLQGVLDPNTPLTIHTVAAANDTQRVRSQVSFGWHIWGDCVFQLCR